MIRIGHGYDVHRLAENRLLILGGVQIPYSLGLMGHSDADVVTHAVMDSLLGAMALGDIGMHFPDDDPSYENADSMKLLRDVIALLKKQDYSVSNLDCTIIAQEPKLKDFIPQMKYNFAEACQVSADCINVKATTEEGLGFTGDKLGIAAHAVCIITK